MLFYEYCTFITMVTVIDVNVCGYCLHVCVKCTIIPNIGLYICCSLTDITGPTISI